MAIVAHLVERTIDTGDEIVDGIVAVVMAIDDAVETTDALIQQAAVDEINALLPATTDAVNTGKKIPDGYFDTNRLITGTFDADDDIVVMAGAKVVESIA